MEIVLDAQTSMVFWRWVYPGGRTPDSNLAISATTLASIDAARLFDDAAPLVPKWLTDERLEYCAGRLGLLAYDNHKRTESKFHQVRTWGGRLPGGSLYDCGDGVLVSSPGFTFLQMASRCSLPELIAFGDELCGLYVFDPFTDRGMRTREVPLITLDELEKYVESAKGLYGYRQAKRALPYMVERSGSPMETADEMFMCLPYRLGGYGLLKPFMNYIVELTEEQRRIAKREYCRGDICYPDIHLDLEHQGSFDHNSNESYDSDRARINALILAGYEVIQLTNELVGDLRAFEAIVLDVAEKLGKRIPGSAKGATTARLELRDAVYGWNRRYGQPRF